MKVGKVPTTAKADIDQEAMLAKIKEVVESLPPGWSKNTNGDGTAPFVHESGRVSWKHPSREQVVALVREMREPYINDKRSLVNRCRMMLKSGISRAAVEQRARLEGINEAELAVIFADYDNNNNNNNNDGKTPKNPAKPTTVCHDTLKKRCALKKYRMMLKAGVPLKAVQHQADLNGVDISVLSNACGMDESTTCDDKENRDVFGENATTKHSNSYTYFEPNPEKNQITFTNGADLTRLVTKLVQTIKKRATASTDLTVDIHVLYHTLGSLKGVQHSRNVYNSTILAASNAGGENKKISLMEARSKRKPFLELASSLGMSPPSEWNEKVDIPGLDDLVKYIEGSFVNELESIHSQINMGLYEFDSLGQLYNPGTRVIAKNSFAGGVGMMCEVVWNRYEQGRTLFGVSKTFKVCFQFIVAVGNHFTLAEFVEGIDSFEGKRDVKNLSFVPQQAWSSDDFNKFTAMYSERGRLYNKISTKSTYMAYEKGSFYAKRAGTKASNGLGGSVLHSGGRLMVDIQGAYEAGHSVSTGHESMVMGIKYKYKEYMLHMRSKKGDNSSTSGDGSNQGDMVLFDSVPDDYLPMTWPAVVGFSFHAKVWGDVLVDGLKEIDFQEDIFDKLVLPPARKRMVKALVKHSCASFHDVVQGKGQGSVFLLYGKPGVGKTLTAEAICEMLHKPLYTVSLGQLGSSAADLETNLHAILTLCSRWDALILLDEADIFLEKRSSTGSLERNAMVSVMLRLVEYFTGVLFLTTNRVDAMDPAFKTRITLALCYDSLDHEARNQIWINLLESSGLADKVKSGEIDTRELAKHELNGREIKNSIRLAIALAEEDGTPLSQKFLMETVAILNEFNEQMENVEVY